MTGTGERGRGQLDGPQERISWSGEVVAVQPRIDLLRSFDERQHSYRGFVLRVRGELDGVPAEPYRVAIGKATQAKHEFRVGDRVRGASWPVPTGKPQTVDFHRTSRLIVEERGAAQAVDPPPWQGLPPDLPTYRARGHRRLDPRTFKASCGSCIWGCEMTVEMVIDHWNPGRVKHRTETFCYGPKSCLSYRAGATRKVPGRKGMSWEEEDWVDEEETSHRGPDE